MAENENTPVDVFFSSSTQQYISKNLMAGDWWRSAQATFWRADFWLPEGIVWQDIHTSVYDVLIYPMLLSVVILFFRYCCLEPLLLVPLARAARINKKRVALPVSNQILELIYQQYQMKVPKGMLREACRLTGMTQRQAERWLRRRHSLVCLTKYDKFLDCGFKLVCHIIFAALGAIITLPKPWLWDTTLCWQGFPNHEATPGIFWYYMIILGYYWAITIVELPQAGVNDSTKAMMILHHTLTIALVVFSWTCGLFRIGILVIFVLEYADIALLAAKVCKYSGLEKACEPLFIVFVVLWFLTRCCVLPFWIVRSVFFEPTWLTGYPVSYILKGWMVALVMLNMIWTGMVMRTVARKITGGGLQDVRSASDDSDTKAD
ncbi:ceramide synthase 2-like [Homarus americanus]|uniref:ceramide synthase 2-like n=1 Tax=Homarus americanus TaxID=6706 RepID=UPI001C491A0A|nr:ceramide synthase 2-like [Homarus americanus]